jgi:hypothetical protein
MGKIHMLINSTVDQKSQGSKAFGAYRSTASICTVPIHQDYNIAIDGHICLNSNCQLPFIV